MAVHLISFVREHYGEDAAASLMREHGGRHVYIPDPKSLATDHWLVDRIGMDNARDLCRIHGGKTCYVQTDRLSEARQLVESGSSVSFIARHLGVTKRTAERWIRRWGGQPKKSCAHNGARPPGQS